MFKNNSEAFISLINVNHQIYILILEVNFSTRLRIKVFKYYMKTGLMEEYSRFEKVIPLAYFLGFI